MVRLSRGRCGSPCSLRETGRVFGWVESHEHVNFYSPTSSWSRGLVVPPTSSGLRGRGVVGWLTTTGVEDFGDQTSAQVKDKIIRGTVVRDAANVPALENHTIHGFIGTNTDHIL